MASVQCKKKPEGARRKTHGEKEQLKGDDWMTEDRDRDRPEIEKSVETYRSKNEAVSIVSHYSLTPALQLDSICRNAHFVTQLILVGQKTESLEGIQHLENLTELWVVEAQLMDASAAARCLQLSKLVLYSNELLKIPNLGVMSKLKTLWLSGNKINTIENMDGLGELRDLNLANNKIGSLQEGLRNNQRLGILNLSGNPLTHFEELVPLRVLSSLHSLFIFDPLYGAAPLSRLCNYRSAVILLLPRLAFLDGFSVSDEEHQQVTEFYEGKTRMLRMAATNVREKAIKSAREVIQNSAKDRKHFRECSMVLRQSKSESEQRTIEDEGHGLVELSYAIRRWSVEKSERMRLIRSELDVRTAQMEYELQQAGNMCFLQHNPGSQLLTICQDLLNRASCSARLGQYGVENARVSRVTQVCDRAAEILERWKAPPHTPNSAKASCSSRDTRETSWSCGASTTSKISERSSANTLRSNADRTHPSRSVGSVPSTNRSSYSSENLLLLLTNPDRDLRYGAWPIHTINATGKGENTKEAGIYVTNCLTIADYCWLKRLRIGQDDKTCSDSAAYSDRRRMAAIVRLRPGTEFRRIVDNGCGGHSPRCVSEDGSSQCKCRCRIYRITGPTPTLVFLVEYDYEFQDGTWQPKASWWRALPIKPGPGILDETVLSSCIGRPRNEWNSVVTISATARGVSVMGEFPQMGSVHGLDLSYNLLGSLGSLYAFPNLRELNLRANNLITLVNMRTLPFLQSLDISWNSIRRMIPILQCLSKHTTSLKCLLVTHNPIEDVLEEDQLFALATRYLQRLEKLDNKIIRRGDYLEYPSSEASASSHHNYYPLTLNFRAAYPSTGHVLPDLHTLNASCRYLKGLERSDLWSQIRWADLSGNLMDDQDVAYVFNIMVNLEEISLARNVIESLPLNTFQSCTKLVRMDINSNFLSTLASFSLYPLTSLRILDISNNQLGSLDGLQLSTNITELYACNNLMTDVESIQQTLRALVELKVLDLSGNSIATDRALAKLALFHLKKLEGLNGMLVADGDIVAARETFGGCLDRDALLRHFTWKDLSHLTELSLPRVGLRSVELPGNLLPVLDSIDLSYNNLTRLWGLQDLPSLQTLNLANNQMRRLGAPGPAAVNHRIFPCLTTLYLQSNGLRKLAPLELQHLPALRALFVHNNRLADITSSDVPIWVTALVIDRNKINYIPAPVWRPNNSQLTDLLLEGNTLSELQFLEELHFLKRLFLARNRIQNENELVHLTKLPELRELTLQGNPVCQRKKHYICLQTLLPALARLDGHILDPNFYFLQRQSLKVH